MTRRVAVSRLGYAVGVRCIACAAAKRQLRSSPTLRCFVCESCGMTYGESGVAESQKRRGISARKEWS